MNKNLGYRHFAKDQRRNLLRLFTKKSSSRTTNGSIEKIEELIKSSNEDIARTRAELFSFLAALAFVAVTTFSITDKALLIGSRATLPLLSVTVGLNEFLVGSPFLVLAVHFALLLKFERLRAKCREVSRRLEELRVRGNAYAEAAQNLSLLVGANFLSQWLISSGRDALYKYLNLAIYAMILLIAPVFVLLLIVVRTLPLHQEISTTVQMVVFFFDVWLIAYLHLISKIRIVTASLVAIFLWLSSSLLFCVPDGYFDRLGASIWPMHVPFVGQEGDPERHAFAPTAYLLENALDEATRRPIFWFSRNLVVEDDRSLIDTSNFAPTNIVSQAPDRAARLQTSDETTVSLRGRNLRYAILDRSDLHGADFTLADLSGASLRGSNLRGATFGCAAEPTKPFDILWARMRQTSDAGHWDWVDTAARCTDLSNVRFDGTDLRKANFVEFNRSKPSLNSAFLSRAQLDGVDLSYADLSLANLDQASLIGATLSGAKLVGADLTGANLTGADFGGADLTLSSLSAAALDGANLSMAHLTAAEMTRASLIEADLNGADLVGAHLVQVRIWETGQPKKQDLAWADLSELVERRPDERERNKLKASMARLIDTGISLSLDVLELQKLLESSDRQPEAIETPWADWAKVFVRSVDDSEYRTAIATILKDIGCHFPQYTVAIGRWMGGYSGEYIDTFTPRPYPQPPSDPAVEKAREATFIRSIFPSSIDFYPDMRNPISEWIDLRPLDAALSSGECEASKALSAEFMREFHDEITNRGKGKDKR